MRFFSFHGHVPVYRSTFGFYVSVLGFLLPSEVLSGYSDGEGELLNYRCNSINLVMKIACMTTDCHEMKETGARDRQLSTKSVSLRNMATR